MSVMLVGISGKKKSGKSSIASLVVQSLNERGLKTGQRAFAGPLKELVIKLFNAPRECVYGSDEQKSQMSPFGKTWRQILQDVGEGMRQIDPDVWIKAAFNPTDLYGFDVVIFDDTRHPNEANRMDETYRLTRWNGVIDNHISETALDNYAHTWTVHNDEIGLVASVNYIAARIEETYNERFV